MNGNKFFIGRQPILNRQEQIIGFELLFRSAQCLEAATFPDVHFMSASVILNALSDFGIQEVLGRHRGFFNVTRDMLMSDTVELLPKGQVVIELLESIVADAEVVERCHTLKSMGFQLALDDHVYAPEFHEIYDLVDIVKVDVLGVAPEALAETVQRLKPWPLILLAEKVESFEEFQLCSQLGFHLFQGYYFARPVVLKQNRVDVGKLAMLQLMEQVLAETEIAEIEETFKKNPGLTFNLLRLVNSVAIGLRVPIKTLRHALTVLGQEQLKRWISLALYADTGSGKAASPLLELAAIRGKLMELLVLSRFPGSGAGPGSDPGPGRVSADRAKGIGSFGTSPAARELADRAFMAGILSLIDTLFEVSMEELVQKLNLVDDVALALLEREGDLGRLLALAETLERAKLSGVNRHLEQCGLTPAQLVSAQLETIAWADRLSAAL